MGRDPEKSRPQMTKKQMDKKLEKFMKRLEKPEIKAVFKRLKDK